MILVYVQHLLGSGHLQRIRLIAEELYYQGYPVTIVSGGMPHRILDLPGIDVIQLEPIRSEGIQFNRLIDADGNEVEDALLNRRSEILNSLLGRLKPRVIVIESYPFGRRVFRTELLPWLAQIRQQKLPVKVLCSIRDVLQLRKKKRLQESSALINQYFDHVMVHGDETFIPLDDSFECAGEIKDKLVYTGYVAPGPVPRVLDDVASGGDILVSAGGGAAGALIYSAALEAARDNGLGRHWRILVGSGISEESFQDMISRCPDYVTVERNRDDFRHLLSQCSACICQAGYNTIMDILVTGAPALVIPFEGEGETEQLMRSQHLLGIGRVSVLREAELTASSLLSALEQQLQQPQPNLPDVNLEGARNSADFIIEQYLSVHPS